MREEAMQDCKKVKVIIDDIISKLEILYNNPYQNTKFKAFSQILGNLQELELTYYDVCMNTYRQRELVALKHKNFAQQNAVREINN